jgi:3-methyladenine DNA glycosylase AlkC
MKNAIQEPPLRALAADLGAVWAPFDEQRFLARALAGLESLELLDRARHVADVLRGELPADVPQALEILGAALGPPLELVRGDVLGTGAGGLFHLVHGEFVARHALAHFDPAFAFMRELTRRFTAEFAVRPFVEREPQRALAVLSQWAADADPHVRRLVSEGLRPRLPWGRRLRVFERDPTPVLALLERLRDDPTEYVRRSVANHLNDLGKDRPELLVATARRWLDGAPAPRVRLVGRALRSLVKAGHAEALALLGAGTAPEVAVRQVRFEPHAVERGGRLVIALVLASTSAHAQDLLVDYAVHYVKADGSRRPKVFKGRRLTLAAGAEEPLRFTRSFADMTTRRHHPGRHAAALLVNGAEYDLGEFELLP